MNYISLSIKNKKQGKVIKLNDVKNILITDKRIQFCKGIKFDEILSTDKYDVDAVIEECLANKSLLGLKHKATGKYIFINKSQIKE